MKIEQELTTVAKGAGITFGGKTAGLGIKYLTEVVLARLLGTELFGLYAIGIVIYKLGEVFSGMGLQSGTVRYVSIYRSSRDRGRLLGVLQQSIGLPFFGGLILGSILFLTSGFIAQEVFNKPNLAPVLRIFAVAIPFGASMTVGALATSGFQTTKYLVYIRNFFHPITNLILIVFVGSLGWSLWGAAVAWVLASILGLILAVYFILKIFPEERWKKIKPVFETKRLLQFSLPLALGDFLGFILLWMDTLMLGYFRSASEVGIYRAASQTALLLMIFLNSLNTIFSPLIAELFHRNHLQRMEQLFKVATRWSFSLTLPLFLFVWLAGQDILRVFGSEFSVGWLPLVVLSIGQLVNAGTGGIGYMLIMSGHQYLKLLSDVVLVSLNIVLNILLIPRWGLLGAAVATAISIAGVNIIRGVQVYIILKVQAYTWSYFKPLGAGIITAITGLLVRHWFSSVHFFISLIVMGGIVILSYSILLWGMGLEESDKMILKKLKKKLGFKRI